MNLQKLKDHELINLNASLEYLHYTIYRRRNYSIHRNFTAKDRIWESTSDNRCVLAKEEFDLEFSEEQVKKYAKKTKTIWKLLREVEKELERRGLF